MLKELTVPEALQLLVEKYPEPVTGYFWDGKNDVKRESKLFCVITQKGYTPAFESEEKELYNHFAIEVPDEYHYMTQQECLDWACLHCNDGYQAKPNCVKTWHPITFYSYSDPSIMTYRTIQEIDGKIVYGEPQEFKVKVKM